MFPGGSNGVHKGLHFTLRTMDPVQGLLNLSLCRQANDIQDQPRHSFVEVHHQLFPGVPRGYTRGFVSF